MEGTSGLAAFRRTARRRTWVARGMGVGWCALAAAALLAGCESGGGSARRELTQRERDSTLGKSVLPGAAAVTRALGESDRAGAAARSLDAQMDSLGH